MENLKSVILGSKNLVQTLEKKLEVLKVQIKKLREDVTLPTQQTPGSAGYDLYAYCPEGLDLPVLTPIFIPTGIAIAIPPGYDIEIRPRSGLSTQHLLFLPNSPGTIDSDYRGEIKVCLINFGKQSFRIEHRMRIAQILIRKTIGIDWEIRSELDSTERGSGGFGSTGL